MPLSLRCTRTTSHSLTLRLQNGQRTTLRRSQQRTNYRKLWRWDSQRMLHVRLSPDTTSMQTWLSTSCLEAEHVTFSKTLDKSINESSQSDGNSSTASTTRSYNWKKSTVGEQLHLLAVSWGNRQTHLTSNNIDQLNSLVDDGCKQDAHPSLPLAQSWLDTSHLTYAFEMCVKVWQPI